MADRQKCDTFVLRPLEAADYHKSAVFFFHHLHTQLTAQCASRVRVVAVRRFFLIGVWGFQITCSCYSSSPTLARFLKRLLQMHRSQAVVDVVQAGRVEHLQKLGADHHVAVIEDVARKKIVATGSILIEYKFVHNCGKAGHIEDVVVDSSVRGQRLGQRIVEVLTTFAKEASCYKVILDCATENATFYEKCGLSRKEIQMAKYF